VETLNFYKNTTTGITKQIIKKNIYKAIKKRSKQPHKVAVRGLQPLARVKK
jgi:hypothetical protein